MEDNLLKELDPNMDFDFKFLPLAEENIEEATDYYAGIWLKVLKNFNKQLDLAIDRIITNPHFQKRYRDVRAFNVRNFLTLFSMRLMTMKNDIYPFRFLHSSES